MLILYVFISFYVIEYVFICFAASIRYHYLGGGFKYFFYPGEMIQFEEHIVQRGWNHQLVS